MEREKEGRNIVGSFHLIAKRVGHSTARVSKPTPSKIPLVITSSFPSSLPFKIGAPPSNNNKIHIRTPNLQGGATAEAATDGQ